MATPFYQPSVPRPTAVRPDRVGSVPRFTRPVIHRLARFARALRPRGLPRRDCGRLDLDGREPRGRDVLWRAKCNALHRALADHDLTTHQARTILCRLSSARGHGCELALLGRLTGFDAAVLDRAVPLLGLQNFIAVRETAPRACSAPVLWVSATEHGLRYAAEALGTGETSLQGRS